MPNIMNHASTQAIRLSNNQKEIYSEEYEKFPLSHCWGSRSSGLQQHAGGQFVPNVSNKFSVFVFRFNSQFMMS